MTKQGAKRYQQRREEIQEALDEMIEDTIKSAGPPNALAWTAVAVGGFLLNLLLLIVVTGG